VAEEPDTRCGVIVLLGRPNAGKSTLFNALVGEPLAIVSPRPQSTRLPVIGVRTERAVQLILVDPAGLLEPAYLLQERLLAAAHGSLRQAHAVLYLHPAPEAPPPPLERILPAAVTRYLPPRRLTVLTKADRCGARPRPGQAPGTLLVSATSGQGIDALLDWCRQAVPPGAFRFDPEEISTQPVRFFAEEFVREAAFQHLDEELPYAVAAEVEEFREDSDPVYIRITIHVERDSQRGIVVGRAGRTIRAIGMAARRRIEGLLQRPVYLDLRVKVLPRWRTRSRSLHRLGFPAPSKEQR